MKLPPILQRKWNAIDEYYKLQDKLKEVEKDSEAYDHIKGQIRGIGKILNEVNICLTYYLDHKQMKKTYADIAEIRESI